jgi:hypothetical protein
MIMAPFFGRASPAQKNRAFRSKSSESAGGRFPVGFPLQSLARAPAAGQQNCLGKFAGFIPRAQRFALRTYLSCLEPGLGITHNVFQY